MQTKFYEAKDISFEINGKKVQPCYPLEARVLKAITTSFANNNAIAKFYNEDGTYKTEGIKKTALQMFEDCLVHKHKSVFFTANIEIQLPKHTNYPIDTFINPKYDLQGLNINTKKIAQHEYEYKIVASIYCLLSIMANNSRPVGFDKIFINKLNEVCPNIYRIFKEHILDKKAYLTTEERMVLNNAECEYIYMEEVIPFFLANQLKRTHFGLTEVSGRYTPIMLEMYGFFTPTKWRKQNKNKKQCSLVNEFVEEACFTNTPSVPSYESICKTIKNWYNANNENEISKEMTRFMIPLSAYTMLDSVKTKGELARICSLRMKPDAQKEIRDYITENYYPYCCERWGKENFDNLIDLWERNF